MSSSIVPTTPHRALATRAELLGNSPHYSTTRRHSLYGTEDRIVIDPGSRLWKVGFSGEGRPRDVFIVKEWSLGRSPTKGASDRAEEERLLELYLQDRMRSVFFNSLLADPKSRKVIVIESPLLPLAVKDILARILFTNLEVPSVTFMPSHLLALLGVGRTTGLVLDCGYHESSILPIFTSRPLFAHIRTTALAGARLTDHLRALLLLFATYRPPHTIIRAAAPPPQPTRIPEEILTDELLEEIKTRCLFVALPLEQTPNAEPHDSMDVDRPSDFGTDTPSESGRSSRMSVSEEEDSSPTPPSSRMSGSIASGSVVTSSGQPEAQLRALSERYQRHSKAKDIQLRVVPPPAHAAAAGSGANARGTLVIPGWIRERAAEVLFEKGDVDERSIPELVLDALLKAPVDLRVTLASTILVVGGAAMLPGFIPRLQVELVRILLATPVPPPPPPKPLDKKKGEGEPEGSATPAPKAVEEEPPDATTPTATRFQQTDPPPPPQPKPKYKPPPRPPYHPHTILRNLIPHIAIINNPSAPDMPMSPEALSNVGRAPAFAPALLPWVGGSLAGALKLGSEEVLREKYDEAYSHDQDEQKEELEALALGLATPVASPSKAQRSPTKGSAFVKPPVAQPIGAGIVLEGGGLRPPAFSCLPDWTKTPLSIGAPNAVWNRELTINIPPGGSGAPVDVAG